MYKFNWGLFEKLPKITGTNNTTIKEEYGICASTWYRSVRKQSISVSGFVELLNRVHISLSHFLVVGEVPQSAQKGLIVPAGQWIPITWHNERIGHLYGNGQWAIAPTPHALSKLLQRNNQQQLQSWEANPDLMRIQDLVYFLNTLKLDAKLFLEDANGVISVPQWEHHPDVVEPITAGNELIIARLQNEGKAKDKRLADLNHRIAQLVKENQELRNGKPAERIHDGVLQEQQFPSIYRLTAKGYNFNVPLLKAMPEIFGMTERDFRRQFGLHNNSLRSHGNIKITKLIDVCNYFRMSICHFFPPKSEPLVVHDKYYYEISPRLFTPVESRLENLRYIFGKFSVYGYSIKELRKQTKITFDTIHTYATGKTLMAVTLADICTQFNISPMVFLKDDNKKGRPAYAVSQNELLVMNSIEMMKEIDSLRSQVRKLKKDT